MPSRPNPPARPEDDALELPPLDDTGPEGDEAAASLDPDELELDLGEEGDLFDDATPGSDGAEELLEAGGVEAGWLLDADDASALDIGPPDLDFGDEADTSADDELVGGGDDDDLAAGEASAVVDGGEEGPLADDEELREEDLPSLDADDEGDGQVSEDALFEVGTLGLEELRWADRAWARVPLAAPAAPEDEVVDSGAIPVPGLDPQHAARDARWRALEEAARVTAAALLPGASVVLSLASPDGTRARLVRVLPDGEARIIAEIERGDVAAATDDEGCEVTRLAWDDDLRLLVVSGNFGAPQAFQPV